MRLVAIFYGLVFVRRFVQLVIMDFAWILHGDFDLEKQTLVHSSFSTSKEEEEKRIKVSKTNAN